MYDMYEDLLSSFEEYSRTNNVDIFVKIFPNKQEYYSFLKSYFESSSDSTKLNAFIIPGEFYVDFMDNFEELNQDGTSDEYSTNHFYETFDLIRKGVMLSSEFNILYYHTSEIHTTIPTWDQYVTQSRTTIADQGQVSMSCVPLLYDNIYEYFQAILAPILQTQGTTEGIYFDKITFQPLVLNYGFENALRYLKSVINPNIHSLEDSRSNFLSGACWLTIDSAAFGRQIVNSSYFNASNVQAAVLPGASSVYDREKDKYGSCNGDISCFNKQKKNFAPFIMGGWVGTINIHDTKDEISAVTDLYKFLTDTILSTTNIIASKEMLPIRSSQLLSSLWKNSGYNELEGYSVAMNISLNHPNAVVDLRIPYNLDFITAVRDQLYSFIIEGNDIRSTAEEISSLWVDIIQNHTDVPLYQYYLRSLDSEVSESAQSSSSSESSSEPNLAAIIAIPVSIGSFLLLLIFCLLLLLLLLIITIVRYRRYYDPDSYEPRWAIDFDEIELIQKIGAGSFGDVYEGIYRNTAVAVKIPREKISNKEQFIQFFDEVAMMRDLRHPNVVLFMGARIQSPNQCIVTEYMPRGSLYNILHDESIVMDWMLIQTMALDAAQGMDFLHSASPPILHRDFKSPNLLVDKKWNLKVADFGLTKFQSNADDVSKMGPVGSIFWAAPEVLRDRENYTKKSDVYSYGIVLWELLTRSDPYQGMNPMYVALSVMEDGLRPPIPDYWHGDIVKLLNDCWNQNPDVRPSFSEIRKRLELMDKPFEITSNHQGNFSVSPFISRLHPNQGPIVAPQGNVTFLFTDIKGYSTLWEHNPLAMKKSIEIHNQIIRFIVNEYHGYEVKSESDSFMIAFQEAENAVLAAVSIQEELMKAPWPKFLLSNSSTAEARDNDGKLIFRGLRVRIGINSGAAYHTTDIMTGRSDYFGSSVNKAAQITGMCEGGETLISSSALKVLGDVSIRYLSQHIAHFSRSFLTIGRKNKQIYRIFPFPLMKRADYFEQSKNFPPQGAPNKDVAHHAQHLHSRGSNSRDISKQPWVINFAEITLGKKIGAGTFGEVYKAKWNGVDVAVKKFFKQQASDSLLLELKKESVIMSQLRHPNILLFLGACIVPPNLCIVTEYMKFGSVAGILHNKSIQLPFPLRIRYLKGAARGMWYLHGRKFIHRDLTSYNLLVGNNNTVKVGDFGLSRIKESNATMTLCGTAAWTAPEILKGLDYSEKSDIYSFGIIMWECLTRRLPFKGMDMIKISKLVTKGARPSIPQNCPELYQTLMTNCWKTDPNQRPSFDSILISLKEISDIYRKTHTHTQNKHVEISDEL